MARFFTHKIFKKTAKEFSPIETGFVSEKSFIEEQRDEALDVLIPLYKEWWDNWLNVKNALGELKLSKEGFRRLDFYETEQRKSVISIMASILVDWERDEMTKFGEDVVKLAKEMRPSLPYVEYSEGEEFELSLEQIGKLRSFMSFQAKKVKDAVIELQNLSWKKFEFKDAALTQKAAEELLEERLGITWFEFLDFNGEVEYTDGYFPALLQQATDDGMNI